MDQMLIKNETPWECAGNGVPDEEHLVKLETGGGNEQLDSPVMVISSDEDSQNEIHLKTEFKVEEDESSLLSNTIGKETMMESKVESTSTTINNSCDSDSFSAGSNQIAMDVSINSHSIADSLGTREEDQATQDDSEEFGDVIWMLEKSLKAYCEVHMKSQNMLSALACSLPSKDLALLNDIIASGQELASSIKLMADTIKQLADAERIKSKAAIIRTRIELARAKRDGIQIQ